MSPFWVSSSHLSMALSTNVAVGTGIVSWAECRGAQSNEGNAARCSTR